MRPARTARRAMGSARNRSMRPFWRSSASPMAVPTEPKIVGLHQDAGNEVVHVGDAGNVDDAAEDVAKQDDEHDRLNDHEDDRHGNAEQREQVSSRDRRDVADRPAKGGVFEARGAVVRLVRVVVVYAVALLRRPLGCVAVGTRLRPYGR